MKKIITILLIPMLLLAHAGYSQVSDKEMKKQQAKVERAQKKAKKAAKQLKRQEKKLKKTERRIKKERSIRERATRREQRALQGRSKPGNQPPTN